jgi:hypothetical protein
MKFTQCARALLQRRCTSLLICVLGLGYLGSALAESAGTLITALAVIHLGPPFLVGFVLGWGCVVHNVAPRDRRRLIVIVGFIACFLNWFFITRGATSVNELVVVTLLTIVPYLIVLPSTYMAARWLAQQFRKPRR